MNRAWPLALGYVAIAIALLAARPVPTPGPPLRDFEAYWSAGSAWNAHVDPYSNEIWQAERSVPGVDAGRDELLPFINPPPALLLWSLLARLPYRAAATLWAIILAGALLALITTVLRASGAPRGAFVLAAALALAIAFGPITSDLALGQLALPAFLGATLLVVLADRSIPIAAAAATLAFAAPNVALGLASQLARARAALAIAAAAAITYALGVVAAGWSWPVAYAAAAAAHGAAERFVTIQLAPAAIAYGFGATPRNAQLIAAVPAILALAAALLLALRLREPFARFTAWSALVPFVAIFLHEHDLLIAYPAALWCALRTRATARTLALAGALLVSIDWLGLAQRPTGIAQSALLAIAAFAAFVALGDAAEARIAWRVALPTAVLFAGAALLAAHHPAPVWPDSLGNFHAASNASIAEVWLAEQRAGGLLAVAPAWAFLRALPLLGCALLAFAIYRHCPYRRTASTRQASSP
ncbi:MAG: glycosyltransferase 87 family protein [Candidatus Cybelea sp.]